MLRFGFVYACAPAGLQSMCEANILKGQVLLDQGTPHHIPYTVNAVPVGNSAATEFTEDLLERTPN